MNRPTLNEVWDLVFDEYDQIRPEIKPFVQVIRCTRRGRHLQVAVVASPRFGTFVTWHPADTVSRVGASRTVKGNRSQWMDEWIEDLPDHVDAICRCGQQRRVEIAELRAMQ